MALSKETGSTNSNRFSAIIRSNFLLPKGCWSTSESMYSQFFWDSFFASSSAENDVSIPNTRPCFLARVLDIIPIDEPYSMTRDFDGNFTRCDLMVL